MLARRGFGRSVGAPARVGEGGAQANGPRTVLYDVAGPRKHKLPQSDN